MQLRITILKYHLWYLCQTTNHAITYTNSKLKACFFHPCCQGNNIKILLLTCTVIIWHQYKKKCKENSQENINLILGIKGLKKLAAFHLLNSLWVSNLTILLWPKYCGARKLLETSILIMLWEHTCHCFQGW